MSDSDLWGLERLVVDGIESCREVQEMALPIFTLLADPPREPGEWFRQRWNDPPSEQELDRWVRSDVRINDSYSMPCRRGTS